MKRSFLSIAVLQLVLSLFLVSTAWGGINPFVTKWLIKGAQEDLVLPVSGDYKFRYKEDKQDATWSAWQKAKVAYGTGKNIRLAPGTYIVEVDPVGVTGFNIQYFLPFSGQPNGQQGQITPIGVPKQLVEILKWGDVKFTESVEYMLYQCRTAAIADDAGNLDLTAQKSLNSVMQGCWNLNSKNVGDWDVSKVENFESLFASCWVFNADLNRWNTSNATKLDGTFFGAKVFNGDISSWDIANVKTAYKTFYKAAKFNSDLSRWNPAKMEKSIEMFAYTDAFNADISGWKIPASWWDMGDMFLNATAFNADINEWDMSKVKNVNGILSGATAFNRALDKWKLNSLENYKIENETYPPCIHVERTGISTSNWDKTLLAWSNNTDITHGVHVYATGLSYTTEGKVGRDKLISDYGWVFELDSDEQGATIPNSDDRLIDGKIVLNKSGIKLAIDGTETLTAELKPSGTATFVWSTDDANVAEVDQNGKVTAKGLGVTKVWVKVMDGTNPKYWESCEVRVEKAAATIQFDKSNINMFTTDVDYITASVTPNDATDKYITWSTDNQNVAVVNNGRVEAVGEGTANIKGKLANGAEATCQVVVTKAINPDDFTLTPSAIELAANEKKEVKIEFEANVNHGKGVFYSIVKNDKYIAVNLKDDATLEIARNAETLSAKTKAKVKVWLKIDETVSKDLEITLLPKAPTIVVESVTVTPATTELRKGKEFVLKADVLPETLDDRTVTWSSEDDTKLSVDPGTGKIKALADEGTVKVFATANADNTKKNECTVTLLPFVQEVTIDPATKTLKKGEELELKANVKPDDLKDKSVVWTSSDPTKVSVDKATGKIKALAEEGKVTITATSVLDPESKGHCTVTLAKPTAVEDPLFAALSVTPNPFVGKLILTNCAEFIGAKYELLTVGGVRVLAGEITAATQDIDTEHLPAGVYLLRLTMGNATKVVQLVK